MTATEGHTLSCGIVIVRGRIPEFAYLLLRAFDYWDFPKGMCEEGEEPLAAARREVCEETTLQDLAFHWDYRYFETAPYGKGKVARYYLAQCQAGEVSLPINPMLGRAEHDEYRWVDYAEAGRLVSPRVGAVLQWAHAIVSRT